MMLTKTEGRPTIPRDGRHCDLCGCSQPAVRCDKCGRQIFCLSCDDMYHRHPKRRFHLRKAVDTTPPTTQARPVLPAKAHATLGGDPSKMPLPPPRKKKPGKASSFFDTFRRRSPSAESSPPLPKKEYSWTDRFGNIKKFMSNRPLPPLPDSNGAEESPQGTPSSKHDLSFIHKKVDEKPPQLPQRSLKPNEFTRTPHDLENRPTNGVRDVRNGTLNPAHMSRNNGYGDENQCRTPEHHNPNTLMPGYMYPGSPGYPGNMSASAADLHNMEQGLSSHQYPHYPPMNPHMPPSHYPPFLMYPQYPGNFPGGYFGSSFANLSSQPATTTDGDHSDHSDATTSRPGKKYQFRKRAKRSQSVLMDRMAYPSQFYPFGPFPTGYGPWGGGGPFPPMDQPPPSPSGSVRSLNRVGRTRRRKKTTSEDEEEFSVSSSPLSRPKSSSSSGRQKAPPVVTSSSEDEYEEAERSRTERVPRRDSDPKKISSPIPRSPQMQQKKFFYKQKRGETPRSSNSEEVQQTIAKPTSSSSKDINAGQNNEAPASFSVTAPWIPAGKWECVHCTFVNPAGSRICQVCCKTASVEGAGPPPADGGRSSSGGGRLSASSEKSCSSPEKRIEQEEEDVDTKRSKQDMAVLNSALDEAEKEISRGLEELMKLKEDFPPNKPTPSPQNKPEPKLPRTPPPPSKPVYKSSGKMRHANSSILDKITMPAAKPATTSTCTETQTGQTSTSDRVLEARRGSTSSTTSDAYNSPTAQSPVLGRTSPQGAVSKGPAKRDTSIQTQTDDLVDFDRRRAEEEAYFGRPSNGYGFRYGDVRMDAVTSPVPSMYDRGGYHHPVMQRSHSRASLFTGRMNDLGPLDYGLGPSPMYRSVSRSSLTGDYPENSFADFHNLRKPAYYLSMEELVERRRQDSIRAQGLELVRMIREAEQQGFTADDIQVALHNCSPHQTPVEWLQENWRQLAEQVIALSANYANEKRENDVGVMSDVEAREALRLHKGNVWPAVTECVESRQRKFLELKARGKFSPKDITDALSANQGDVELAYAKLTKSSSKPFLMRIWGAGEGAQNQDGAIPPKSAQMAKNLQDFYYKDRDDIQSEGTWDDDEVVWDEDYDEEEDEEEEEQGDLEDLQTCHEDVAVKTPDSDRSDYCDAFGSNTLERNASLPSPNEPEIKLTRRGSFLSKLAGLKRNDKDSRRSSQTDIESQDPSRVVENSLESSVSSSACQSKSYNPISVIKNTISAIRDTVGGSKSEKKLSCAAPEWRTIVVKDQIPQELSSLASGGVSGVTLTSVKPIEECDSLSSETTEVIHKASEEILNKYESKDLPKKTTNIGDVNQKLTASPTDSRNMNGEPISPEYIASQPHRIGISDEHSSQGKLAPKLQETTAKKETSASQEYKSNVIADDKGSTSKCENDSSKPSKSDKFSLKANIEKKGKDLKSEQKTQDFVKDTKAIAIKESMTSFSPEPTSSPNIELPRMHASKEEQRNKTKNYLGEKSFENEQLLVNKVLFDDVSSTFSSNSNKIPEMENEFKSTNEEKNEISNSNDQDMSNATISDRITSPTGLSKIQDKPELKSNASKQNLEMKDTTSVQPDKVADKMSNEVNILSSPTSATKLTNDTSETHVVAASKEITYIIKAGGSKHVLPDLRPEDKDSHLTNILRNNASSTTQLELSPSIDSKAITLENNSSIQRRTDTLHLENEEGKIHFSKENNNKIKEQSKSFEGTSENIPIRNFISSNEHSMEGHRDLSNVPKQNNFESNTNKLADEVAHVAEADISSEGAEIPLLGNVDTCLIDSPSYNNCRENDSSTYESMEPIHSSTFKRSLSNQSSEGKPETQMISETASAQYIEKQSSSTIISRDANINTTSNETLTSEAASVNAEIPLEMTEIGIVSDSEKNDLKVGENKILKERKGVLSTQLTSEDKNFAQLKEAPKSIPSTSSTATTVIKQDNFPLSETNSLPSLETGSQIKSVTDPVSDSTSQTKYQVTNKISTEQNVELHSKPSIHESNASVSISPSSNTISSLQSSFNQEDTNSIYLEHKITEPVQKTTALSTAVHSASVSGESLSDASVSIAPIPSDSTIVTSASVTVVSSASLLTASTANASTPVTSVSVTSVPSDYIPSANFSSSTTLANDDPVSTVSVASAPTAPLTTVYNSAPFTTPPTASESYSVPINSVAAATIPFVSNSTASLPTASNSKAPTTAEPSPDAASSPIATSEPYAPVPSESSITTASSIADGSVSIPVASQETSCQNDDDSSDGEDDVSEPITPPSPVDALRHRFEGLAEDMGPIRPASPFRRMSFRSRKEAIALERTRDTSAEKPWYLPKPKVVEAKKPLPKRSLKQQMETERKVRQMVADRKVRTYRKAEVVVQLTDLNFEEEEAIQAANECSTFEMALSYLQQECLLCTGHFPVSHIISMVHCPHKACRECIRAYFTVQIRDRNIMELLCPFCNEPDISDEDIAQDYFNHLDMMLKKLVDPEIHELFQRKLRDRVLMRDPSFRWCSKCSSGFLAMENLKRLVCPDCNAVTCASCRRPWDKEHQGITCEAFATLKDGNDSEAQAVSLAKLLTEDGIDCPRCHFRYALAKGGCMHFRCIQCQHDFCSGCSRPFKMGQKCGVSEFCAKLGLHAHHPRNCLFYLRDKDPEDLQRLLDLSEVKYDRDLSDEDDDEGGGGARSVCQVMEQKETSDGMVDDCCGKEVEKGFAGLCRLHYVEYLGQLVNKHQVDPIQIFENDDLELVLRRANIRLPPKRYRESDESYREKLVNLIHEELPLDKMDGS